MKNKLVFTLIGFVLYCASAAAQEASQPAVASAPFAGATISDFKGKVGIQLPAQAFAAPVRGEILPPDTTVSTDDGRLLLRLSDGSDVLVRPHTKLLLKQPEASGWKYFQLLVGRVRTQIQKRLGGSPAFQIGTPSAVISVRGTKFDVEVDRRGFTEVDVDEGVVELEAVTGRGESVMITAGFSSRVGMETGPEVPRPTQDLRPQLDRPSRRDNGRSSLDDDDPIKSLRASDQHDTGDHHGGDPSGSDSGSHSSGSDSGDHSSGSGSSSGSDGGSGSGSDGGSGSGDDHHHGGKPPEDF
ncbi:MAG: FecR family protein [Candidatus Angelobacter sp.]